MSSANKGQAQASGAQHTEWEQKEDEEERVVPPLWYIDFGTCVGLARQLLTCHFIKKN
jgi:hypothetical protein